MHDYVPFIRVLFLTYSYLDACRFTYHGAQSAAYDRPYNSSHSPPNR